MIRDEKLELIYESIVGLNLPKGIDSKNIQTIEDFLQDGCVADLLVIQIKDSLNTNKTNLKENSDLNDSYMNQAREMLDANEKKHNHKYSDKEKRIASIANFLRIENEGLPNSNELIKISPHEEDTPYELTQDELNAKAELYIRQYEINYELEQLKNKKLTPEEKNLKTQLTYELDDIARKKDNLNIRYGYIHPKKLGLESPKKNDEGKLEIHDQSGNIISLSEFIKLINVRPEEILSQNQKMQKTSSDSMPILVLNTSLPALKGIYYDRRDEKLKILTTCPSAGGCARKCYARDNGYISYENVVINQSKCLTLLMNEPKVFMDMFNAEIQHAKATSPNNKILVRWHDSGDFFSDSYIAFAIDLAKKNKDVLFYAYTKEFVKFDRLLKQKQIPENFELIMSYEGAHDKQLSSYNGRTSVIIPKDLFDSKTSRLKPKIPKDKLKEMSDDEKKIAKWTLSEENMKILKLMIRDYISDVHNIKIQDNNLLSYEEMEQIPYNLDDKNVEPIYSVIVTPKDGDMAAIRKDVKHVLLLEH